MHIRIDRHMRGVSSIFTKGKGLVQQFSLEVNDFGLEIRPLFAWASTNIFFAKPLTRS